MLPWMQEKFFGSRQRLMNIFSRRIDAEERTDQHRNEDMFVTECNSISSECVSLTVINLEGNVLTVDAAPDCTVEKLKLNAVDRFYSPDDLSKAVKGYKLVLGTGRKALDDRKSVVQEELKNNDQLLLLERRMPIVKDQTGDLKAPTPDEIKEATKNLELKNAVKPQPSVGCVLDFENGIRKVLISLVEASARVLTPSPDSEEIFQVIKQRLENKGIDHIIKQLTDMGFPRSLVVEALHLNSMNPRLALDWLLKHSTVRPKGLCEKVSDEDAEERSNNDDNHKEVIAKKEKKSVIQSVASLLDSFRAFKRQYFKPNEKAIEKLKEMGFEEEDIIDALQATGNHETSACEWLLGEKTKCLTDVDTGLDPEGPIYKAIMENPVIQLSLTNPKMLLAFLSMLENPSNTNVWINDPDAAPVLSQIFKTYHTEKHLVQPAEEEEEDINVTSLEEA